MATGVTGIGWGQIGYGAVLSRRLAAAVRAAAAGGAAAWNAILHAAHGQRFFTDAPLVVLPVSWQDTGSAVFALAAAGLLLGAVVLPTVSARQVARYAALCGLVAFLVDVYLY